MTNICSGTHHRESRHLVPTPPPVVTLSVAEQCSAARVRFAPANHAAPLPPVRRSAAPQIATGGSDGNQKRNSFFVLHKTRTR